MKVETDITLEDLIAFNRYHAENSQFVKRREYFIKYLGYGVAIFMIGIALLEISRGKMLSALINIAFAVLLTTIIGPRLRNYTIGVYARGMYKEGENEGLIGRHIITIRDDAIVEESDAGTHSTKWQSIEKIVKTKKYIFVYANAISAYLIPRRFFMGDIAYDEIYNLMLSKKDVASQQK